MAGRRQIVLGTRPAIAVIDREQFSQEVQSVLHGDGPSTEVQYRLAWARTHLKGMGLITNSQRGVWTVTETGQSSTQDQFDSLNAAFVASRYKEKKSKSKGVKPSVASELADVEADWKDELLETLLAMSPKAFERLNGSCVSQGSLVRW